MRGKAGSQTDGGGQHVIRQVGLQMAAQLAHRGTCLAGGHQVCHQAAVGLFGRRQGEHDCFAHVGMLRQGGFDFAQLDAEAMDFDLMIQTAEEFQRAIGPPAREISALVEAGTASAERVGDKALRGESWPAEIAAGQAHSADMQLAGDADGLRFHVAVQHIDLNVGDGAPNRNYCRRLARHALPGRHIDGGFGGSVEIV